MMLCILDSVVMAESVRPRVSEVKPLVDEV